MSESIHIENPAFSYRIGRKGIKANSRVSISRLNDYGDGPSTLFHIDHADFITRERSKGVTEAHVQIKHPFARDIEGDLVYIVDFTIDWLVFVAASGQRLEFGGILKEARFYADPEQNPLAALREEDRGAEAALGLPYQPPRVQLGKLELPIEVRVTIEYGFESYSVLGGGTHLEF